MGIRLFKKAQRKGYASESLNLISNFVKEKLNLKIKARCLKDNCLSKRLFENNGFVLTAQDSKYFYFEKI